VRVNRRAGGLPCHQEALAAPAVPFYAGPEVGTEREEVSGMVDQRRNDDDQLLEVLRDALSVVREMPRRFVEVGKAAYVWRTIDAELAALTYDSAWDTGALAPTRAESATLRALRYASDRLTIELEPTPDEVLGRVSPPEAGTVSVRADTVELGSAPIDHLGSFVVRPVPSGPFRLICHTASGASVLTGWVLP
jgi:hypothetical protein